MRSVPTTMGEKLRVIRKQKGMTLSELAKVANCSASLISGIERGVANPSFTTVKAITDALGVLPSQFLTENMEPTIQPDPVAAVVKREQRKVMIMGLVRFELLSRGGNVPFEFVLSEYEAGASTERLLVHEGVECGLLLEGELQVEFEHKVYRLKPGDSISFPSRTPHRVSNPGKKRAAAYWVNSASWLFSTK